MHSLLTCPRRCCVASQQAGVTATASCAAVRLPRLERFTPTALSHAIKCIHTCVRVELHRHRHDDRVGLLRDRRRTPALPRPADKHSILCTRRHRSIRWTPCLAHARNLCAVTRRCKKPATLTASTRTSRGMPPDTTQSPCAPRTNATLDCVCEMQY